MKFEVNRKIVGFLTSLKEKLLKVLKIITYKCLSIGNVAKIGILRLYFTIGVSEHREQWIWSLNPELRIYHRKHVCEGKQDHQRLFQNFSTCRHF